MKSGPSGEGDDGGAATATFTSATAGHSSRAADDEVGNSCGCGTAAALFSGVVAALGVDAIIGVETADGTDAGAYGSCAKRPGVVTRFPMGVSAPPPPMLRLRLRQAPAPIPAPTAAAAVAAVSPHSNDEEVVDEGGVPFPAPPLPSRGPTAVAADCCSSCTCRGWDEAAPFALALAAASPFVVDGVAVVVGALRRPSIAIATRAPPPPPLLAVLGGWASPAHSADEGAPRKEGERVGSAAVAAARRSCAGGGGGGGVV